MDGNEASSIPSPTSFSHPFSRPLHITILEPVTGYLPHCEKGWFVRSVNTMKIGWSSWPYLNICVYCLTRSLLIPFWVDQFCYHHASVTTSVYVDGCASVKLLLYAMGPRCSVRSATFAMVNSYPRRSDPGLKPSRGRAPIHETDGYRRLSAGV